MMKKYWLSLDAVMQIYKCSLWLIFFTKNVKHERQLRFFSTIRLLEFAWMVLFYGMDKIWSSCNLKYAKVLKLSRNLTFYGFFLYTKTSNFGLL